MTAPGTTAIDILLEPGSPMIERAEVVNAGLLAACQQGFPLDEAHRPHITMLQAFVRTESLGVLGHVVGETIVDIGLGSWSLRATGFYYLPWGALGVVGVVVEPTDGLMALQQRLIEVAEPFLVDSADASAFVRTTSEPDINQPTIDYVGTFRSERTGGRYNPHVTVGVGPQSLLDEMVGRPFEEFTFSPSGVSIYQLGNLGTAARLLRTWGVAADS